MQLRQSATGLLPSFALKRISVSTTRRWQLRFSRRWKGVNPVGKQKNARSYEGQPLMRAPVAVGEEISFVPAAFSFGNNMTIAGERMSKPVKGRVVYINRRHRYFTAEYKAGEKKLKESFKF